VEILVRDKSQPVQKGQLIRLHFVKQQLWNQDAGKVFNLGLREEDVAIRSKIEAKGNALQEFAVVKFGIKLYETGKGVPAQKPSDATDHIFEASKRIDSTYRRYLEGKDVNRYSIRWQNRWLKYGENLAAPRDRSLFIGSRLLIRRIVGERLIGTFTDADFVTSQLLQIVKPEDDRLAKYLLGVLNSSLIAYYFKKKYNRTDKTFPEIRIYELAALPIYYLNLSKAKENSRYQQIVKLVERMLELHKQLATAKTDHTKTNIQRQIDATDAQIDKLVYELYELTPDEIKIVERAQ
jgi:hypothetical protein